MLEMEEDDQIEAYLEQLGGGVDEVDLSSDLSCLCSLCRVLLLSQGEDSKAGGDDAAITISVKGQDGEATQFKVKKSTKLQKVFDAYIARKGVNPGSVRFLFDGQAVQGSSTPKMLEMNDEDQIDAVLQQVGGL
jgi:small ubiquitin-related modifier